MVRAEQEVGIVLDEAQGVLGTDSGGPDLGLHKFHSSFQTAMYNVQTTKYSIRKFDTLQNNSTENSHI